jgi:uncharacterized protein (TIGR02246 family)
MNVRVLSSLVTAGALAMSATQICASPADESSIVANLDTTYQAAVERNDADAMAAILHEDMILVLGDGKVLTGRQLVEAARTRSITYERQVEDAGTQTVRMFGDTAIVTARLWLKGVRKDGTPIDRRLWFSDTYVRTTQGWKYAFGQASLALPPQ